MKEDKYFDIEKRTEIRETARKLRRQFLRYQEAELVYSMTHSKKLFYCISKQESPFTANTTKCINIIAIFIFASMVCPLYPYYHISFLSIIEGIFIVLIFRSITLIFKYGCNLQKEIDETL